MVIKKEDRPTALGTVRIVPMHRRHLRAVVRIERSVYPRAWTTALFLSELAQRKSRRYRVAASGLEVVGYAGLMMVEDEGHVNTLTVAPELQHRGIGTLLLADCARGAIERGARSLTLEVRTGNANAQALYRRFGFAPVGIRRNYYPETGEDAIVMWVHDVDTPAYAAKLHRIESRVLGRS